VCGGGDLVDLPRYAELMRVTSDCKPWPRGGQMCACADCGTVQKPIGARWRGEIAQIYANYTIYFQASGVEQAVFNPESGEALLRSERLVRQIAQEGLLGAQGRLLDIGCGNGAFLSAFSRATTGWRFAGTEWSDKYLPIVEAIPGVEQLYMGDVADVPGMFDFVSLIHALEHIPEPVDVLRRVAAKLYPGGLLFIEVPNLARNPFDLLVADHASHFTPDALVGLLEAAGFDLVTCTTEWVAKEISVLARKGASPRPVRAIDVAAATDGLRYLLDVLAAARDAYASAAGAPFSLFGSSIAATWLGSELGETVQFFVDEDANRRGGTFMDRPILHPSEAPAGAHVFIALGGDLAPRLAQRLGAAFPSVAWHAAPRLVAG
jgi:SAM-dependent methyltransferase